MLIKQEGRDKRASVWIVFSLSTGGNTTIQAICTRPETANKYRRGIDAYIKGDTEMRDPRFEQLVRVWIEAKWVDHLIAFPDLEASL